MAHRGSLRRSPRITHGARRDRIRLLVEVIRLYYDQQRSQKEIAEQLDASRASVSRLLMQARTGGLVHITIRNPFAEEEALEERLVEAFGLQAAAVCRTVARLRRAASSTSSCSAGRAWHRRWCPAQ